MALPHTDAPYQLILSQGLPDATGAVRLRQDLPAAEWQWITRLRRADDRLRSLAGRALVRRLLGRRLGLAPETVRLDTGPHGKPGLAPDEGRTAPPWHFNIAHSGDLVLVGIGPGPLGVDVEHSTAPVDAALWQQVTGAPPPVAATPQAFCAHWVRREAVLKACGQGLSLDPATLQLTDDASLAWTPVGGHLPSRACRCACCGTVRYIAPPCVCRRRPRGRTPGYYRPWRWRPGSTDGPTPGPQPTRHRAARGNSDRLQTDYLLNDPPEPTATIDYNHSHYHAQKLDA